MGTNRKQWNLRSVKWPKPNWFIFLPYLSAVLGILIVLLFLKGLAVVATDRILYSIPILGGMARSLEVVEFFNLILFSILGMGLGFAAALIPKPNAQDISQTVLVILIPILFLTGCFFQYQLWLADVQNEMQLNPIEVRRVTNQWLKESINHEGIWGFYHFTTKYSVLPTNTSRFEASIQGHQRVTQLFAQILSLSPKTTSQFLSFCVWLLRLFYLTISVLAALHHFQDGLYRRYQLQQRSQRSKPYKKVK